jgi:phospho-N-acetylmuramoyl-pentapeptide-transferase
MLYYLFDYLNRYDIAGAGAMQYTSVRAGFTLVLSLIIATWIGGKIIRFLKSKQVLDQPRDLDLSGLSDEQVEKVREKTRKSHTPTMGGIIIIIAILVPVLLFCRLNNIYVILMLITTVFMGALGFLDDYIKVFKKHKEGLQGKFKLIAQLALGLIIGLAIYLSPDIVQKENVNHDSAAYAAITGTVLPVEKITADSTADSLANQKIFGGEGKNKSAKKVQTTIPFFKNNNLDYESLVAFMGKYSNYAAWFLFVLVVIFFVMFASNGANLNDGLDGMAAGNSAIIGATLGILAFVSGHAGFAAYLDIMLIPGVSELVVFAAAFVGALIGFLWYNAYPAQVFMGDTGSLTIGGIIGVFAVLIHKELLLFILCGVFFIELLSVTLQRLYFKFTKKRCGAGIRILKMTPFHHHFQMPQGSVKALIGKPQNSVPEAKLVARFWMASILLAIITIVTLKIR